MTYEYDPDTGILTYTISESAAEKIREANVPPGNDEGATALRIIAAQRLRMLESFGKCELRIRIDKSTAQTAKVLGQL